MDKALTHINFKWETGLEDRRLEKSRDKWEVSINRKWKADLNFAIPPLMSFNFDILNPASSCFCSQYLSSIFQNVQHRLPDEFAAERDQSSERWGYFQMKPFFLFKIQSYCSRLSSCYLYLCLLRARYSLLIPFFFDSQEPMPVESHQLIHFEW